MVNPEHAEGIIYLILPENAFEELENVSLKRDVWTTFLFSGPKLSKNIEFSVLVYGPYISGTHNRKKRKPRRILKL